MGQFASAVWNHGKQEPWLWGAVVRAPGVGTEVGELQYTAVPQVDGSGGVLGYGLHAQGVPMGDRGFVQWELKRLVGKAVEKVRQCRTVLASMPSKQFHLHTVNLSLLLLTPSRPPHPELLP